MEAKKTIGALFQALALATIVWLLTVLGGNDPGNWGTGVALALGILIAMPLAITGSALWTGKRWLLWIAVLIGILELLLTAYLLHAWLASPSGITWTYQALLLACVALVAAGAYSLRLLLKKTDPTVV